MDDPRFYNVDPIEFKPVDDSGSGRIVFDCAGQSGTVVVVVVCAC